VIGTMRQQSRFFITVRILLVFFAALVLGFAETAHATITFSADTNTVSGVDGTGTSTIIYGGIAGSSTAGRCDSSIYGTSTNTCDNCAAATPGSGDAGLVACNKRRIMANGQLRFTLSSDQKDGTPILVFVATNGTVTKIPASTGVNETAVTHPNVGTITVDWSQVCTAVGATSSCALNSGDEAAGSFKIGIDVGNDGTLTDGTDDSITIQIKVRDGIERNGGGEESLGRACSDTSALGICYFETNSGDKKFELRNLNAINNFPVANNISFKFVRVLFEKRTDPNTPAFSNISAGSDYADLEVGGVTDALTLTPSRVVGLDNDAVYDVKVASVDAAGNTGYYTQASLDAANSADSCPVSSLNPSTGAYECHTARPSEVVGILSEPVNCFVATAAYGSPMEQEVSTFRAFRERFLAHNSAGRAFIRWYYVEGPKMASFIAGHEARRSIARAALALPLAFSKFALREGGYAAIGLLVLIFGAPIALGTLAWARRRKRGLRA